MNMFGPTLLIVCVAIPAALAKCQYEIVDFKLKPCKEGQEKMFDIQNPNVVFDDSCNLLISGTGTVLKPLKELTVEYNAKKDGMQILKGTKAACNEDLFDTKLKCPMAKDTTIKSTPKWIYKLPKGALAMATGNIVGTANVRTDNGNVCYSGTAKVKKV